LQRIGTNNETKNIRTICITRLSCSTEPSEDNDEWVTGDGAKPYTWNGSKDTDVNLNDMSKEVEKDRK